MIDKRITIGFSIHRPDVISMTAGLMQRSKAILLDHALSFLEQLATASDRPQT
jgi:hypothetical protein